MERESEVGMNAQESEGQGAGAADEAGCSEKQGFDDELMSKAAAFAGQFHKSTPTVETEFDKNPFEQSQYSLMEFFRRERQIAVMDFQRPAVWQRDNQTQFMKFLMDACESYKNTLGTITLQLIPGTELATEIYSLIDGQQRTLNLHCMALAARDQAKEMKTEATEAQFGALMKTVRSMFYLVDDDDRSERSKIIVGMEDCLAMCVIDPEHQPLPRAEILKTYGLEYEKAQDIDPEDFPKCFSRVLIDTYNFYRWVFSNGAFKKAGLVVFRSIEDIHKFIRKVFSNVIVTEQRLGSHIDPEAQFRYMNGVSRPLEPIHFIKNTLIHAFREAHGIKLNNETSLEFDIKVWAPVIKSVGAGNLNAFFHAFAYCKIPGGCKNDAIHVQLNNLSSAQKDKKAFIGEVLAYAKIFGAIAGHDGKNRARRLETFGFGEAANSYHVSNPRKKEVLQSRVITSRVGRLICEAFGSLGVGAVAFGMQLGSAIENGRFDPKDETDLARLVVACESFLMRIFASEDVNHITERLAKSAICVFNDAKLSRAALADAVIEALYGALNSEQRDDVQVFAKLNAALPTDKKYAFILKTLLEALEQNSQNKSMHAGFDVYDTCCDIFTAETWDPSRSWQNTEFGNVILVRRGSKLKKETPLVGKLEHIKKDAKLSFVNKEFIAIAGPSGGAAGLNPLAVDAAIKARTARLVKDCEGLWGKQALVLAAQKGKPAVIEADAVSEYQQIAAAVDQGVMAGAVGGAGQ